MVMVYRNYIRFFMSATAGEVNYKENYLDNYHLKVMVIKKLGSIKRCSLQKILTNYKINFNNIKIY